LQVDGVLELGVHGRRLRELAIPVGSPVPEAGDDRETEQQTGQDRTAVLRQPLPEILDLFLFGNVVVHEVGLRMRCAAG